MWIDGKFMSESEISAYIKQVKQDSYKEGYLKGVDTISKELAAEMAQVVKERNAYKRELIETLRKAATCAGDEYADCSVCPYDEMNPCPTKLTAYAAGLRLEELTGETHK